MTPTLIETPNGERLILLPEADYRELVARAEGRQTEVDRQVIVPAEIANRIFAGESPLRVYSQWRDMTATHLALKTGLSEGHISDIMKGRRNASPKARAKLAEVLELHPDDLIPANPN